MQIVFCYLKHQSIHLNSLVSDVVDAMDNTNGYSL